jgi:hypothetical protein
MAGNSLCPSGKMGTQGEHCASCVYEREDQQAPYFKQKTDGRELLSVSPITLADRHFF